MYCDGEQKAVLWDFALTVAMVSALGLITFVVVCAGLLNTWPPGSPRNAGMKAVDTAITNLHDRKYSPADWSLEIVFQFVMSFPASVAPNFVSKLFALNLSPLPAIGIMIGASLIAYQLLEYWANNTVRVAGEVHAGAAAPLPPRVDSDVYVSTLYRLVIGASSLIAFAVAHQLGTRDANETVVALLFLTMSAGWADLFVTTPNMTIAKRFETVSTCAIIGASVFVPEYAVARLPLYYVSIILILADFWKQIGLIAYYTANTKSGVRIAVWAGRISVVLLMAGAIWVSNQLYVRYGDVTSAGGKASGDGHFRLIGGVTTYLCANAFLSQIDSYQRIAQVTVGSAKRH